VPRYPHPHPDAGHFRGRRTAARSAFACFLLGAALTASGQDISDPTHLRRFELPNRDTLELTLPAGWTEHLDQPDGGGPPTIEIAIAEGGPRQVFVTPEWPDPLAKELRELPSLRDAVREMAERTQPQAVEPYLEVRQLDGANGTGFYFAATDRNPGPGEFRFMHQGALLVGDLTLWFSVLTNEGQDTVAVEALAMLQTAVHRRTGLDQL
jgi:hypothetical protein